MSDREDNVDAFSPIPELDDHRHQQVSQRRGTFDSIQLPPHLNLPEPLSDDDGAIVARDFEEAVSDNDMVDAGPMYPRSRRPTVETQRSISPPNSVKAFAEARRRERGLSFVDTKQSRDEDGRTLSFISRHTSVPTNNEDTKSVRSQRTADTAAAEKDVCFPVSEARVCKDQLIIDFEFLEDFAQTEKEATSLGSVPAGQVFPDLRPARTNPSIISMMTATGDIINMPAVQPVYQEASSSEGNMEKQAEEGSLRSEKAAKTEKAPEQTTEFDPDRINFFSSAWESTIHASSLGGLLTPGQSFQSLFHLPQDEGDGVWWLNVNNPTKDEIHALCKAFSAHPLTLEDIATQESREKIELFPAYYFACFRSFQAVMDDGGPEYEPFNIYAIVFREGTLSFSFAPNHHASHVRKRIALLKEFVSLSSDWICYALIDDIVDSFAPVIKRLECEVDSIEDAVYMIREEDSNVFLKSVGQTRKNIMALMRILGGKADVLKGFTKRCNENYKVTPRMDIGLYLGDIQDHVITMMNNLGHFEKMLSRVHSNYLAQLSINHISQGTETNKALSKITLVGSLLVPLNLISGMFGMNVLVPFQNVENLAPFFCILAAMILVCSSCLAFARRYHYI